MVGAYIRDLHLHTGLRSDHKHLCNQLVTFAYYYIVIYYIIHSGVGTVAVVTALAHFLARELILITCCKLLIYSSAALYAVACVHFRLKYHVIVKITEANERCHYSARDAKLDGLQAMQGRQGTYDFTDFHL